MTSLFNTQAYLPLAFYEQDVYSQFGQDGVLEHVLSIHKPLSELVCFEVGGWDGVHYSNTCNLAVNHSSQVFFVEADCQKYQSLLCNHESLIRQQRVFAVNTYVDSDSNSVSNILRQHNVDSLDFLSIDVDGLDYYIFEQLDIEPAFVLIEFNHSIHHDLSYVQPYDPSVSVGASARAIYELASQKGYSLIHSFHTDLLFVKSNLAITYGFTVISLESVELNGTIYAFTGYDGSLHTFTNLRSLQGGIVCPWVGRLTKNDQSLQLLPDWLIFFPDAANLPVSKFLRRSRLFFRKLFLRFFVK